MAVSTRGMAIVVTAAFGTQAAILVAIHLLPTGYDPTVSFTSEYALTRYAPLMKVGQIAAIVGMVALISVVRDRGIARLRSVLGAILLLNVAARVVARAFRVDPVREAFAEGGRPEFTAAGWAHVLAGMVAAVTLMIAMGVLTVRLSRAAKRLPGHGILVVLAVAAPVAYAAMMASRPATFPAGLLQRLFIAATLGWLLTFGIGMAARAPTLADDDEPEP